MNNVILKCVKIQKNFTSNGQNIQVLRGISIDVSQNEIVSIVGVSGVGKSTLLYILAGLDHPTDGDVLLEGKSLLGYNPKRLARIRNHDFGFVFQTFNLIPELDVLHNVMLPSLIAGIDSKGAIERAKLVIERVHLEHRIHHDTTVLSGGEKQRVAMARALVNKPKIVFCDEPTGNLDEKISEDIFQLISELNRQDGTTFLVVTHDVNLAKKAHRIIRMVDGRIDQRDVLGQPSSIGRALHS